MKILLKTQGIRGCEPLMESVIKNTTPPEELIVPVKYLDGRIEVEFVLIGMADGMPYYQQKQEALAS